MLPKYWSAKRRCEHEGSSTEMDGNGVSAAYVDVCILNLKAWLLASRLVLRRLAFCICIAQLMTLAT